MSRQLLLLKAAGRQYTTVNIPFLRGAASFGPAPFFDGWDSLEFNLLRLGAREGDVRRAKNFFERGNDGYLIEIR